VAGVSWRPGGWRTENPAAMRKYGGENKDGGVAKMKLSKAKAAQWRKCQKSIEKERRIETVISARKKMRKLNSDALKISGAAVCVIKNQRIMAWRSGSLGYQY